MNKIALIIQREYLTRVKKKSFLITTLLVPLIIAGFYAAIIAITMEGNKEVQKIAVIDNAHLFNGKIESQKNELQFTFVNNETEQSFLPKYKKQGFQSFLFIPDDTSKNIKGKFILHSETSVNLITMSEIEELINNAVRSKQLLANGIDPKEFDKITDNVSLENTIDTKEGSKKSVAEVAYGVSFFCGLLIYIMMLTYGTQVMRGVTEEKTNRIAEVIISSVKPFQLMMGKIIGIGAVGLTQFLIWMVLLLMMQMAIPVFFPEAMQHLQQANAASSVATNENAQMIATTLEGISSLPIGKIIVCFLFYFLAGYLTYASIFAAIGSVVSEDQQEAQQLVMPVMMPIILGFVIMTKAVNDPNSSLAVFGSIFPLTSPIVMMGRITSEVPSWQLAISMLCLAGSFVFFTWVTAKIYRTGILMYGKKITWKEMIKWIFIKS